MDRASAYGAVKLGLKSNDFLIDIYSFSDAQYRRDSVKNKPASLLVVALGKGLSGIPSSWFGKRMIGNS